MVLPSIAEAATVSIKYISPVRVLTRCKINRVSFRGHRSKEKMASGKITKKVRETLKPAGHCRLENVLPCANNKICCSNQQVSSYVADASTPRKRLHRKLTLKIDFFVIPYNRKSWVGLVLHLLVSTIGFDVRLQRKKDIAAVSDLASHSTSMPLRWVSTDAFSRPWHIRPWDFLPFTPAKRTDCRRRLTEPFELHHQNINIMGNV